MRPRRSQTKARAASSELVPLSEAIEDALAWLEDLQAEAEHGAERYGPLRGRVTLRQQPWSRTLDRIAGEREAEMG